MCQTCRKQYLLLTHLKNMLSVCVCKFLCTFFSRPEMNSCSSSEAETNNFHAPPPGMTSAYILSSTVPINGKIAGKVRKTSRSSSFQDSPKKLPSSMKKKQQSAKEKTWKEPKDSYLMNGLDLQQPKSSDIYLETGKCKN